MTVQRAVTGESASTQQAPRSSFQEQLDTAARTEPEQRDPARPAPPDATHAQATAGARPTKPGERTQPTAGQKPAGAKPAVRTTAAATTTAKATSAYAGVFRALATARSAALATRGRLNQARQGHDVEAGRLGDVRAELHSRQAERIDSRLRSLIARATRVEEARMAAAPDRRARTGDEPSASARTERDAPRPGAIAGIPAAVEAGARAATSAPVDPSLRADAALALVEKIELMVRAQRPALALSIGGHLSADVEVERTGPREVALTVRGRHGPPAAADLDAIRDALSARGLSLRHLTAR